MPNLPTRLSPALLSPARLQPALLSPTRLLPALLPPALPARGPSPRGARLLMAAVLAAPVLMAGCYERVVRARGPGADRIRTEEPYQQNYRVDDWLFGKQPTPKKP